MTEETDTIPMIRKERRRVHLSESSSSDATARSKAPNEVLALGDRLVRELELDQNNNTLARWLAHHLAEVMLQARNTEGAKKAATEAKAVDLILKLWASRHELPNDSHPLKQFEGIIKVLRRLEPDSWPYSRINENGISALLADTFHGLQELVFLGLVLPHANDPTDEHAGDDQFLEEDERAVVAKIREWIEFARSARKPFGPIFVCTPEEAQEIREAQRRKQEIDKLDQANQIRVCMSMRIDDLLASLVTLKAALDATAEDEEDGDGE